MDGWMWIDRLGEDVMEMSVCSVMTNAHIIIILYIYMQRYIFHLWLGKHIDHRQHIGCRSRYQHDI